MGSLATSRQIGHWHSSSGGSTKVSSKPPAKFAMLKLVRKRRNSTYQTSPSHPRAINKYLFIALSHPPKKFFINGFREELLIDCSNEQSKSLADRLKN